MRRTMSLQTLSYGLEDVCWPCLKRHSNEASDSNAKWPTSLVRMSKPLITVITAIAYSLLSYHDLQVLQNKAPKIILDRPLYSSATDALETLKWLNLEQRRFFHRCIYVYKCINGFMEHSMELLTNWDIHNRITTCLDYTVFPEIGESRESANTLWKIGIH